VATAQAYAYRGRDASGKVVKGKLDASSEAAVASRLNAMGLSPISITASSEGTGLGREITIPGFLAESGDRDFPAEPGALR